MVQRVYYVKYRDGTDDRLSFATGLYSTNYKAETEALRAAAAHIENNPHLSHRVVFLSDALSVLQTLQTGKETDLNNLVSNLSRLCMKHTVILQWIPSHCGIHGNEKRPSSRIFLNKTTPTPTETIHTTCSLAKSRCPYLGSEQATIDSEITCSTS